MARTIPEADQMIRVAKHAGIRLLIAENYPYRVPIGAVRRMVRSGALGDLKHIELSYSRYIEQHGWRREAARMGGGAMVDGGIHLVSALSNIAGDTQTVFAMSPPQTMTEMEGEDSLSAIIKMKSGAVAQLLYSWVVPPFKPVQRISAFGTKGSVHVDLTTGIVNHFSDEGEKTWRADSDLSGSVSMLADFVEVLKTGQEPMLSVADCHRDLSIVMACYDSLKSGNPVSLDG
jgi:predicted dehydrogenase